MEKTAMQKHLEWLKGRMVVTPEMESQLLEEEKQQIIDAFNEGFKDSGLSFLQGEQYYNEKFSN